ncbi:hypothetical protein [Wolbachia endosymbiont of Ctenocephalides felis wCfeJ]|uniref:hypothetical protein n=1 Tax=Wolbachia endosymbiont of Ctenocephalides felis wCfeJ TaxID=2732594 RepID=UPI001446E386|nr:hypothetical protein [Wolbachia endosymbiont of Ctenocephalides felis wCfeJ]WCR58421.1 MAG: hypothetical protein PG980_000893 [Wolbachia endosymbiont of Ctenocephalides felis wCfeJ]
MPNEEKPQDFELIELLIKEASSVTGTGVVNHPARRGDEFESFEARFQSYIDQIPSYLHSVGKEGFFPHFFLGSFSTFIDTKAAKELKIKKMYFRFDGPKILKVAVVRDGGNEKEYKDKGYDDYEVNLSLFVILESGETDSKSKKFTYDELENILNQLALPAQSTSIRNVGHKLQIRSIEIAKTTGEISIKVENEKLGKVASATYDFKEIKKGLWNNPESDIAKLTNSNAGKVKESVEEIFKKVSGIHSEHENSLIYGKEVREAAHHGFIAGALVNFRYRHNLRVYLEQFAGRGYADIVLVPRGKNRLPNAVPIIIELKAGIGHGKELDDALEQAKGYAKGFQPNTTRVLTISDNVLCVGLNLDSTKKFSMHISPREDREIAPPTMQALLKEASDWNGRQDTTTNVKEKIKQPLERIYHTFPGTPEKGGNYFSRFLLGQLLLANEFKRINLERSVFLYDEYPLASSTRSGAQSTERPVTTFMLTKGNQGQNKEVFIFHIREGGRGDRSSKKIPTPDDLPEQSKITEVYVSLQEGKKSDFFNIEEVNRYNSLNEYKEGKEFFKGELKDVPYPNGLREAFDDALKSQVTPAAGQSLPVDKYNSLLKKIGEGMFPFRDFINEEAHFQGALHGVFSHYSDIRLGESQENRALVLTELQTGRGKRIDMLVHGIKFASRDGNAKEYIPVGLELKGPRKGEKADALVKEADEQIRTEYKEGVSYKTLTDGDKVAFIGVAFDEKAEDKGSLILTGEAFQEVEVRHSSVFRVSQLCNLRKNLIQIVV